MEDAEPEAGVAGRAGPVRRLLARLRVGLRRRSRRRPLADAVVHGQRLQQAGQFAMSVAHELNNMLEVIGANAELVAECADPAVREAGRDIRSAERLAAELVRHLLAYGRRDERRPEALDLVPPVVATVRFLDRVLGRTHRLVVEAVGCVPIRASRAEIEQVVTNLVMNARDAMPRGGTVHVRVRRVPRCVASELGSELAVEEQAFLEVEDQGVGIPEDAMKRIFQPFFTTKPPGAGTGLGLAVVQDIVARSSGSMKVESARGRGTRFRTFLPIAGLPQG